MQGHKDRAALDPRCEESKMKQTIIIVAIIMLFLGCAHSPNTIQIKEKVNEYDDVDAFVTWLEGLPNVRDVNVNKKLFLTSYPPKVIVTFFQNRIRHKLLLAVEVARKLRLVKPKYE